MLENEKQSLEKEIESMHQRNTKLIEDVKRLKEDREKTDEEKNEILERFQQVSHTAVFESSARLEHGIEVVRIIDKIKTYIH